MSDEKNSIIGAENIAYVIGRERKATERMLRLGHIPGRRIRHTWVSTQNELRAAFGIPS